jgi:ATP-dependent DNA ligase
MPANWSDLPRIAPAKLSLRKEPFDSPDWLFELKHDGFRCLAYIADGECTLVSRNRNLFKTFKPLEAALARTLKVKNAILDGELVCLDSEGHVIRSAEIVEIGSDVSVRLHEGKLSAKVTSKE